MKELNITKNEVNFLQKEIEKAFINPDTKPITWNSNPKNYIDIAKDINDTISKFKVTKVPPSFLRNFFFHQEDVINVRITSLNKLYLYLYGLNREDYFIEKDISFNGKEEFVFYSAGTTKKMTENSQYSNTTSHSLSDYTIENIIQLSKDPNSIVHLYIDEKFLFDLNGIRLLIELFDNHFISLIVDYNILFHLDDKLTNVDSKNNILTFDGTLSFFTYWEKRRSDLLKLLDEDLVNKITGKTFLVILNNLVKFKVIDDFQSKMKVESFLPILKDIKELKPKPLDYIYTKKSPYNTKQSNFFCVIGYEGYFNKKEKSEMLKYFTAFGSELEDANIIRIFTIPGKRVKNKGWVSLLDTVVNKLLYQYIYINNLAGIETYCLIYDEEKQRGQNNILFHQDYVIKSEKIDDKTVSQLTKSLIDFKVSKLTNKFKSQELYFAYPETSSGKNQCLVINDDLYNIRLLKDFINRLSIKEGDPFNLLMKVDANNEAEILNKLNLTILSKESIIDLKEETKGYLKKVNISK